MGVLLMDSSQLYTIIITILASSGFWSVALYLIQRRDRRKHADTLDRQAIVALLHDRLYQMLTCILHELQEEARSGIEEDEWRNITMLYDIYRKLGGNGTIKKLYERIDALNIVI